MPDEVFPDELDLSLQQKLFQVRSMLEYYHKGKVDLVATLRSSAEECATAANFSEETHIAYVAGYMAAVRLGEDLNKKLDIEEYILDAQSNVLLDHDAHD